MRALRDIVLGVTGSGFGEVMFYRAKTSVGRARTVRVIVDGEQAGTVRGSQRLTLALAAGPHITTVRSGRAGSANLELEVLNGQPLMVVIDVAAKDPGLGGDPLTALVLRPTDDPHAPASRRSTLRFDNETAGMRRLLGAATLLLLLGSVILPRFNHVAAISAGAVGAILLIIVAVRKLLYRSPPGRPTVPTYHKHFRSP